MDWARRPDFLNQIGKISIRFCEQILPAQFRLHSFLQQFRDWERTRLYLFIHIRGEVDLHSWHTPIYDILCQQARKLLSDEFEWYWLFSFQNDSAPLENIEQ
jgi:hypothetical protein